MYLSPLGSLKPLRITSLWNPSIWSIHPWLCTFLFEFSIAFAIWEVRMQDLPQRPLILLLCVILCDDQPLVGRDILRCGNHDGPDKSPTLPYPSDSPFVFPTDDDPSTIFFTHTYLYILHTHSKAAGYVIYSCLTSRSSLFAHRRKHTQYHDKASVLRIACTLILNFLHAI